MFEIGDIVYIQTLGLATILSNQFYDEVDDEDMYDVRLADGTKDSIPENCMTLIQTSDTTAEQAKINFLRATQVPSHVFILEVFKDNIIVKIRDGRGPGDYITKNVDPNFVENLHNAILAAAHERYGKI